MSLTVSYMLLAFVACLAIFGAVNALPVVGNQRLYNYAVDPDLTKRDFEEAVFWEPPPELAYLLQLPRTDRKLFIDNYYETAPVFDVPEPESQMIESGERRIDVVAPSQKEVTGNIVVGPQTKSSQTHSAKKP